MKSAEKKYDNGILLGLLGAVIVFATMATCLLTGCGGEGNLPPCGPGTYEFQGICLPTETEPPCGPGTYEVGGVCVADPATPPPPPVKQLVCGKGTHEVGGKCLSATEVCDGKDNDGDGKTDELDADDDGYVYCVTIIKGVPTRGQVICEQASTGWHLSCNPVKQLIETCDNNVDDNGDGQVDEGCQPATLNILTVSASPDTPSSQTLVMGTTGVELMQFVLDFNTTEPIEVDTVTIVNDGNAEAATATLTNLRLKHFNADYGSWTNFMTINGVATLPFGSYGTNGTGGWPKGSYAVALSIKADVTAWDNGGWISSHRLRVTQVTAKTASGKPVTVKITTGANEPAGNWMNVKRTNLSVAVAADSPSGLQVPAAEQIVAKFTISNGANMGNYAAIVNYLKVTVSQVNLFPKNGTMKLRVYDLAVNPNNLVMESTHVYTGSITYSIYGNIPICEVLAGKSRALIVTLDTANAGFGLGGGALQVSLPKDGIGWTDGTTAPSTTAYFTVDSLPISAPKLTYL